MKNRKSFGFTLLELSAVITIIALVTVFVMKSNKLLSNAKLDSIMADVRFYAKAADKFEEIYGGIPGDFANYTTLPNYNVSPLALAGNGNGKIDTASEALQFWLHLQKAGLINGYYDGASTNTGYDPQQNTISGGFPLGRYPLSIITVYNTLPYGLAYTISGISGSNYTSALLTPLDAYNLDKKYDDGNPDTGIIRAIDGSNVSANSCRTANSYTLATSSASCYLNIYADNKATTSTASSYSYGTCNGSVLGLTRTSASYKCPEGYIGTGYETCTNTSGWDGSVASQGYCEPVSCGMGLTYGQTISLPCAYGYSGAGSITYSCGMYGILYPSSNTCGASIAGDCDSAYNTLTRTLPCPVGYIGTWTQTCNGTSWSSNTFNSSCTAIACSGTNIGSSVSTSVAGECSSWNKIATARSACAFPITSSYNGASSAVGAPTLVNTFCLPQYGSCSTAGNTQTISCPYGQSGSVLQTCNGSYYEETSNSCKPVKCGSDPVGSWRVAKGKACVNGKSGVVLEICTYTDTTIASCSNGCSAAKWQISYVGCN